MSKKYDDDESDSDSEEESRTWSSGKKVALGIGVGIASIIGGYELIHHNEEITDLHDSHDSHDSHDPDQHTRGWPSDSHKDHTSDDNTISDILSDDQNALIYFGFPNCPLVSDKTWSRWNDYVENYHKNTFPDIETLYINIGRSGENPLYGTFQEDGAFDNDGGVNDGHEIIESIGHENADAFTIALKYNGDWYTIHSLNRLGQKESDPGVGNVDVHFIADYAEREINSIIENQGSTEYESLTGLWS